MAQVDGRELSDSLPVDDGLAGIRHVVLDRDGVLNRELPSGWLDDPAGWRWVDGSVEALQLLQRSGRRISVVTNQSGIGRGRVSKESVDRIHDWLRSEVEAAGASLAAILMCPHAPDEGCDCRIPPGETLLIGDDLRDLEAGLAAGVRVALVRTGKGDSVRSEVPAGTPVFQDLLAAVRTLTGSRETES